MSTPIFTPAPWASTRPWRNNNPGDLRSLPAGELWDGQINADTSPGGPFAIFVTRTLGWRALAECLLTYYTAHRLNTVDGIICRYAPALENDTAGYIDLVCAKLRVHRNDVIDPRETPVMLALVSAIALAEGGARIPWPQDEKMAGVAMVLGETIPDKTDAKYSNPIPETSPPDESADALNVAELASLNPTKE